MLRIAFHVAFTLHATERLANATAASESRRTVVRFKNELVEERAGGRQQAISVWRQKAPVVARSAC